MEFVVRTNKREELFDINDNIRKCIEESTINNGIIHIFIPHATAGITLNENADPNLPKDISTFLKENVPEGRWMHDRIDNNADSHIKASLIGNSVSFPIKNSNMLLGTWQDIFLCEFDGPRDRKVIVTFIESKD
ncbi:MAG: secondary thiamine-phosphate synthase enzyme YjbQ [Nanobdellota archaeon]